MFFEDLLERKIVMKLNEIGKRVEKIAEELVETSPFAPDLSGASFGKDLKQAQRLFDLQYLDEVTAEDLKEKYRELMKKWHPDKNKDKAKAAEMALTVQKAYAVLKNVIL